MKHIKSCIVIMAILCDILPIKGMLSRLSRVSKIPQFSRRNVSGLPQVPSKKEVSALSPQQINAVSKPNSSMQPQTITQQPFNQGIGSLLQNIHEKYKTSYLSSLVMPLAWSAALALLPFGIVIIDLDKVMDGLKTVRKNVGIFFTKMSDDAIPKNLETDKIISSSDEKSEEVSKE